MSAGMAVPDPKSSNQTEQLLAEPGGGSAAAALDRALRSILVRSAGRNGLPPGIRPKIRPTCSNFC